MSKRDGSKRAKKYARARKRYSRYSHEALRRMFFRRCEFLQVTYEYDNVGNKNWQKEDYIINRDALESVLMEREPEMAFSEETYTQMLRTDIAEEVNVFRKGEKYAFLPYIEEYDEEDEATFGSYSYGRFVELRGADSAEDDNYARYDDSDVKSEQELSLVKCRTIVLDVLSSELLIGRILELPDMQLVCLVYRTIYRMSNRAIADKLGVWPESTSRAYKAAIDKLSKLDYRACFE